MSFLSRWRGGLFAALVAFPLFACAPSPPAKSPASPEDVPSAAPPEGGLPPCASPDRPADALTSHRVCGARSRRVRSADPTAESSSTGDHGAAAPDAGTEPGASQGDAVTAPPKDAADPSPATMNRPKLLCAPQIRYTKEASRNHVSGDAVFKCTVQTDGSLCDCELLESVAGMDEAVLNGLDTMRYEPVTYKGHAVRVRLKARLHLNAPAEGAKGLPSRER